MVDKKDLTQLTPRSGPRETEPNPLNGALSFTLGISEFFKVIFAPTRRQATISICNKIIFLRIIYLFLIKSF